MTTPGKKEIKCHRCGRCCLANVIAYVTEEDFLRWEREGRKDILKIIKNEGGVWAGDHFISRQTGRPLRGCPFYAFDGNGFGCVIYNTRPAVCRRYEPGESELCPQRLTPQ